MAGKKIPNRQKTPPRKPKEAWRLSDKEKKGLIIGAVALALIVIIWVGMYNASALPINSEGNVTIPEGQNWLVYNEKTTSNPRYLKLGEVVPAEGYVLNEVTTISDKNEPVYFFKPEDETASRLTYGVLPGKKDYATLANNTVTSVSAMLVDATASEIKTAKLGGRDVAYYTYSGGMANMEDAEKIDYYSKQMNAYASAANGKSVIFMIQSRSDTNGGFPDDAEYEELLEKAIAGIK